MAKPLYIHIPKPCHENWHEMTPTQQGAFCKSCQKNVIDFTTKTENEIYDIMSRSQGELCGRFHNFQLNRPIRKTEIKSSFFHLKALAASILAFFSIERIFAQGDNNSKAKTEEVRKSNSDSTTIKPKEVTFTIRKPGTLVIKSRVVDIIGFDPISYATIRLVNSPAITYADENGDFTLLVTKQDVEQYCDSIIVSAVGYKERTFPLSQFASERKGYIALDAIPSIEMDRTWTVMNMTIVGGLVSTTTYTETIKTNWDIQTKSELIDWEIGPRNPPRLPGR